MNKQTIIDKTLTFENWRGGKVHLTDLKNAMTHVLPNAKVAVEMDQHIWINLSIFDVKDLIDSGLFAFGFLRSNARSIPHRSGYSFTVTTRFSYAHASAYNVNTFARSMAYLVRANLFGEKGKSAYVQVGDQKYVESTMLEAAAAAYYDAYPIQQPIVPSSLLMNLHLAVSYRQHVGKRTDFVLFNDRLSARSNKTACSVMKWLHESGWGTNGPGRATHARWTIERDHTNLFSHFV